ncbi:MAG: dehydratase, partial [Actinoallomurus sp.]
SNMVVVPDDEGAEIEISGKIESKGEDNTVVVALTARSIGEKVLTRAKATVRLA